MKITREKIRNLIIKEIQAMGEDVIVPHAMAASQGTPPLKTAMACEQCGSEMHEGECMECGYTQGVEMLEGDGCGCGTCDECDRENSAFVNAADDLFGLGAQSMHIDFPNKPDIQKHKHNNYMAKPSLYKVAKYAQKLLDMIPDGYELDDWQRTKIAQISDDISEVYHSLDYDMAK